MSYVFVNLLTFMWLENALVVCCTEKLWKLSTELLFFPFLFSSWSQILPLHCSHWDFKDWSYVGSILIETCWKKGLEGRGYGIYVVFVLWKETERKEQRKKFVKMCARWTEFYDHKDWKLCKRYSVLEVFNIVGIGLKLYEITFLGMNENSRIGIFTNVFFFKRGI